MASKMSEEEIYSLARKRVEEKKGFRIHFIVYLCVNTLLVIIWWTTGGRITGAGVPWVRLSPRWLGNWHSVSFSRRLCLLPAT